MGGKSKIEATFSLEEDQQQWLDTMAEEFMLPDASKALRVLLDYAMEEGDTDAIFKTIRCRHC